MFEYAYGMFGNVVFEGNTPTLTVQKVIIYPLAMFSALMLNHDSWTLMFATSNWGGEGCAHTSQAGSINAHSYFLKIFNPSGYLLCARVSNSGAHYQFVPYSLLEFDVYYYATHKSTYLLSSHR